MDELQMAIVQGFILILTGLIGWVSKELAGYFKKKGVVAQMQSHKEIVKVAVAGVEQLYNNQLRGEEKLNMAKIEAVKLANSKGIKVSEKDLDILIEAVVKEMNDAMKVVKDATK